MRKQGKTWWREDDKGVGRKSTGGQADGKTEAEQRQVRELLSEVEEGTSLFTCSKGWRRNGAAESRS